jgi:sugar phosphate isomerase/epimerase
MTTSADLSNISVKLHALHLFDNKQRCIALIVNLVIDSPSHVLDAGVDYVEESRMKIGLSSYSFRPLMLNGSMQIEDVFSWIRDNGGEHLELASLSMAPPNEDLNYELAKDAEGIERLRIASRDTGIPLSGICIGANFIDADRRAQINRVKGYLELCDRLDVRFLRHDVVPWSLRATEAAQFEQAFPVIVEACREVAEHAQRLGVVASVEDHGFMMNSSERIKRLLHAVDLPSFKMTLDVGNFLCVDEDPLTATRASIKHASFVHLKDFYVRATSPGPGWLETLGGQHIRGSVFGYGDLPVKAILKSVIDSGYDGFVSLEYEGNEPTLFGCETGLANARRLLGELKS